MALIKVEFRLGKDLPLEVKEKNNINDDDFIEIRIENSKPNIKIEKIVTPAKRIKSILADKNLEIKL